MTRVAYFVARLSEKMMGGHLPLRGQGKVKQNQLKLTTKIFGGFVNYFCVVLLFSISTLKEEFLAEIHQKFLGSVATSSWFKLNYFYYL